MKLKDYYKILGLERTASASDIRKAYFELVKECHPDLFPNNKKALEIFLELKEAYEVLGNLDNRLHYSILLNKAVLDRDLLHKKFDFPLEKPKKRKDSKQH